MPWYEYVCKNKKCNSIYINNVSVLNRDKIVICEKCGSWMVRKLFYKNLSIKFNGPGFYVNDYKKNN